MTDEQVGYRRINAGVFKFHEYSKLVEGMIKFNPYFVDHIHDATLMFQEMFQDKIIDKIGDTGWAIYFVQFNPGNVSYIVDIYVDDTTNFAPIVNIISGSIHKDFNLQYMYRGTIKDYTQNR